MRDGGPGRIGHATYRDAIPGPGCAVEAHGMDSAAGFGFPVWLCATHFPTTLLIFKARSGLEVHEDQQFYADAAGI